MGKAPGADQGRLDTVRFLNEYVNEYIRFADTKVGVALTVVAAFVAVIFAKDMDWSGSLLRPGSLMNGTVAWGFVISASGAFGLGIFAVFPRTSNKPARGMIFWENVIQHKNAREFAQAFQSTADDDIVTLLAEQHYHLSKTADRKYSVLRWLLPITALAVVFGSVALLLISSVKTGAVPICS